MKNKTKDIVIICLILVIVWGGFNQKNFKYVMNNNIYTNLREIQYTLNNINKELKNENISTEEFQDLLYNHIYELDINAFATHKYKRLGSNLEYVDMLELSDYIIFLAGEQNLSEKELNYHKKNIQNINSLIRECGFQRSDNYFRPSKKLKENLKEINHISEKGIQILDSK